MTQNDDDDDHHSDKKCTQCNKYANKVSYCSKMPPATMKLKQ